MPILQSVQVLRGSAGLIYHFRFRRDEVSVNKVLQSVGTGVISTECLDS